MSRTNLRLSAMAASFALAMAGSAHAADVLFDITEDANTLRFTLPTSPTPTHFKSGQYFLLTDVNVDYDGSEISGNTILFGKGGTIDSGITDSTEHLSYIGFQVYTGNESAPSFVAGTYTGHLNQSSSVVTVKITDVSSAPEPATWTLMLVGFGGLGGALRARRIRSIGYRRPFG